MSPPSTDLDAVKRAPTEYDAAVVYVETVSNPRLQRGLAAPVHGRRGHDTRRFISIRRGMVSELDFSAEARARWEPSADELRRIGYRAVDLIADHLAGLPERPVFRPFPNDLARRMLDKSLPEQGQDTDAILDRIAENVMRFPFGNGHPRFHGWVNSPPVTLSVFAEALAAALNPSVAGGNHAATYIEGQVLGWLKDLIGFNRDAAGLLVSGGSAATTTALAVARHQATAGAVRWSGMRQDDKPLIVYTSEEGHSAIAKAVELLGLGREHLRRIRTDAARRIQADALREAIEADERAGRRPMAVAVSAGTVNTGAIDPLADVAAICRDHGVWMHVDGAYGAPAILDERYRPQLSALALADSVALDPHKWLYVPYDAGAILVRDAELMRSAFTFVASYVREDLDPDGVTWLPWYSEFGSEQTRAFRALKIWAALLHHGRAGYADAIRRDNRLADRLAELAAAHPALELVAHDLSIVCLRCTPPGAGEHQLDALNKRVLRTIQTGGQAFLSSTELDGRFLLRACIINPRTRPEHIDDLVDLLARTAQRAQDEAADADSQP